MSFQETSWRKLCDQILALANPTQSAHTVAGIRIVFVDWGSAEPFEIDSDAVDLTEQLLRAGDLQGLVGDSTVAFERLRRPLGIEGCYAANHNQSAMVYLVYRKLSRKPTKQ